MCLKIDGRGLIITGIHTVLLTSFTDLATMTREHQNRIYSPLHVSLAPLTTDIPTYLQTHVGNFSALQTPLPPNVDFTHAYFQQDGSVLIRFQHNFGVNEVSPYAGPVTINFHTLLTSQYPLANGVEWSLTANQLPSDIKRLKWNTPSAEDQPQPPFKRSHGINVDSVTINPMEVRTFVFDGPGQHARWGKK